MSDTFEHIKQQIIKDPSNEWALKKGYYPAYTAAEDSKLVIVGQAPGVKAQESHTPWNDISGQKLREWLQISDRDFYDPYKVALMPMDFYYPGKASHGDLPPRKDFAKKWHPILLKHMPNVELILLVGQYAQSYYLGTKKARNLTETVRNYQSYLPEYFPLVHPSPLNFRWHIKNPWFAKNVIPELQTHVSRILH